MPVPPAGIVPDDNDGDEADEEGGRFYGSGVSSTQAEILSYLDRQDGVSGDGEVIGAEEFAERDVRKLASALDKTISFNEARRSKYDDPAMYPLSLSAKASPLPSARRLVMGALLI